MTTPLVETAPPPPPPLSSTVGGGAPHEPWESWGIAARWNLEHGWHTPHDY